MTKEAFWPKRYFELTRTFWKVYAAEVRFRPLAELQARGIGHCGVCLLARIDGTSPVDYLPEEHKRDVARQVGRRMLLDRPTTWENVLEILASAMASLPESEAVNG